jgi:tetratricopeptide (TPR) repeat protein
VFTGPFTAQDAMAVSSRLDSGDLSTNLLDALVDHSMLVADRRRSTTCYRMLETLRAFARDTLTARERQDRQIAHLDWAVQAAESANEVITGPHEADAVQRFDELFADLRSAHRFATASGDADAALRLTAALRYYAIHRLRDEVFTWAQIAIELAAGTGHALLPVARGSFAQGVANRGELDRARALATEAIERCDPIDHRALWALRTLSNVALYEGRLDQAVEYADQEVAIAERAGDLTHVSYATVTHVLARCYAGDIDEALDLALVHAQRARRSGNPTQLAWSSFTLGEASASVDPTTALAALEAALAHATTVDSHFVAGVALVAIASTQASLGNLGEATTAYGRTIALWHQRGDWTHQWTTLRNVVRLVHHIGRHEQAAVLLGAVTADGPGARPFGRASTELDQLADSIAAAVGGDTFRRLTEDGHRLTPDDAVELAIAAVQLDGTDA